MLTKAFNRLNLNFAFASLALALSSAQASDLSDSETLNAIVQEYGRNILPDGVLGGSSFELRVYGCSRVVYPGAQATCKIAGGEISGDDADFLLDAILEVLGSQEAGLGVTRVPPALITCTQVVHPDAQPECSISSHIPIGGGNVSVGGKTTKTNSNSER